MTADSGAGHQVVELVNDRGFLDLLTDLQGTRAASVDQRFLRLAYNKGFIDGAKHAEKMLAPWWRFW